MEEIVLSVVLSGLDGRRRHAVSGRPRQATATMWWPYATVGPTRQARVGDKVSVSCAPAHSRSRLLSRPRTAPKQNHSATPSPSHLHRARLLPPPCHCLIARAHSSAITSSTFPTN